MPENLEIKLRATRINDLECIAEKIGSSIFDGRQVDTYFKIHPGRPACRTGRLKLRETADGSELVFYRRPTKCSAKLSNYLTIKIDEPKIVKSALTDLFGVKQIVDKHRRIYLYRDARIQLDRVQGLGTFIEIEIPTQGKIMRARRLMASLVREFHLENEPPIPGSYCDLLANRRNTKQLRQSKQKTPLRGNARH